VVPPANADIALAAGHAEDQRELLETVVRLAETAVPDAAGTVVCVLRDGARAAVVASEHVAARLQMLQLVTGAGPGLRAMSDRRPVVIDLIDAEGSELWAGFAGAAGITGLITLPITPRPDLVATLTLYRRSGDHWPAAALRRAEAMCDVVRDLLQAAWPA
jgi:hypothetical protein